MIDNVVRLLLLTANVFVCVYAFTSAGRMEYVGSRWGRITLGIYSLVFVLGQATLLGEPLSVRTLMAVFATLCGLGWFGAEVAAASKGATGGKPHPGVPSGDDESTEQPPGA